PRDEDEARPEDPEARPLPARHHDPGPEGEGDQGREDDPPALTKAQTNAESGPPRAGRSRFRACEALSRSEVRETVEAWATSRIRTSLITAPSRLRLCARKAARSRSQASSGSS